MEARRDNYPHNALRAIHRFIGHQHGFTVWMVSRRTLRATDRRVAHASEKLDQPCSARTAAQGPVYGKPGYSRGRSLQHCSSVCLLSVCQTVDGADPTAFPFCGFVLWRVVAVLMLAPLRRPCVVLEVLERQHGSEQ